MLRIWLLMGVVIVSVLPALAADPPEVSEIKLQRIQGLGVGAADLLTLRADGSADYVGTARVERLGRYRGTLPRAEFDKLVKMLRKIQFFDLEEMYRGKVPGTNRPVTDAPAILVSAICDGKKKTVTDYGYGGPEDLRLLQLAILDSSKKIKWQKDEPDSK